MKNRRNVLSVPLRLAKKKKIRGLCAMRHIAEKWKAGDFRKQVHLRVFNRNRPGIDIRPDGMSVFVNHRQVRIEKAPINITNFVRHNNNVVDVRGHFESTDADLLQINLVEKLDIDRAISKLSTMSTSAKKVSEVLSGLVKMTIQLKCPLSKLRIDIPVKGRHCQHLQCFDAKSFLKLNESVIDWKCPCCNGKINGLKDLLVDLQIKSMLGQTDPAVERVVLEDDGWYEEEDEEGEEVIDISDSDDENENDVTRDGRSNNSSRTKVEAIEVFKCNDDSVAVID